MESKDSGSSEKAAVNLVGLGASAGGIEALCEFVSVLAATSGMAFLLVQHRDPGHPSVLGEILSKNSSIPIVDARDGTEIEGDHFYIIPADATVAAVDGALRLHPYDSALERRLPIDAMFRVLAHSRGHNSIGVVLSGTGSDGAMGIQEIKGRGGITFAQEPNSARFSGMPKKAIETECVDFVLTARGIAEKISEIAQHPYLNRGGPSPDEAPATDENSLNRIFRLLRAQAHVDFSQYKRSTIQRRLGRRLAMRHVQELADYEELLHKDRGGVDALVQDFLIRVTGFFRHT
jgi:two-component system, chemotaxis family, CheB/CheR fusion protein